jgi:cellulose synthase/poly-beta-1,6-N-acetylglucosamine synthase-like glycosyltransferase
LIGAIWSLVGGVAAMVTLPGTVELTMLSVAALFPGKELPFGAGAWRVAVVVPAHDEEAVIRSCVESLMMAARGGFEVVVWVIADHCTDGTAEIAEAAGAHVIRREDPLERGKGPGLHDAFIRLTAEGYDGFLVVDADTVVSEDFLVRAAGALRSGADAVQVRYTARQGEETMRTRLMDFALSAFNWVRPRGRERMGVSVGILGNGFGLRRETVEAVPYLAASLVEDLEYHLALVRAGRRVRFVEGCGVFGEMPVRGKGVKTQRARWEGGRLHILKLAGPGLFGDVVRGRMGSLEPLLDLLLLPLAFHVVLLAVAATAHARLVGVVGSVGLAVVAIHLAVTIIVRKRGWRDVVTLAGAPFYVAWKLLLIPTLVRHARAKQEWVRTDRNATRAKDADDEGL